MYDRFPYIPAGDASECAFGWSAIARQISTTINADRTLLCVECYPGSNVASIAAELRNRLEPAACWQTESLFRTPQELDAEFAPLLTNDPVFGVMNRVEIADFFDNHKLAAAQVEIAAHTKGLLLVIGSGASLVAPGFDVLVYADMARWELQQRQRRNQIGNLGANNLDERASLKYKRAFFLDWRAADRLKCALLERIDFLLDTNTAGEPKSITGASFRRALSAAVHRPFRVVPFFDPGPWGGHWMERVCNLPDDGAPNHAWCFDCVPEENSLLLGFGPMRVEVPALNVVFAHPVELLGQAVFATFGAEFPIRFDFLDTMGGGNLSLQVHPLTEYVRDHFGLHYTQDESYYMLDAEPSACVYLGLKEDIVPSEMLADLKRAHHGDFNFPAEKYVNTFPAKKHDHFLIPAGTVHCSGKDSMVLEISATPYIFTFKLWDWGRLGLDGRPRPIHLEHGASNIQWQRTTEWVRTNLVNQVSLLRTGDGWREERTGLHPLQSIETRRHWFTQTVEHDTTATGVNVMNLVQGEQAIVESSTGSFAPFVIHYAETFIVPAAVGRYTIRPHGPSIGNECATMLAYVRTAAGITTQTP